MLVAFSRTVNCGWPRFSYVTRLISFSIKLGNPPMQTNSFPNVNVACEDGERLRLSLFLDSFCCPYYCNTRFKLGRNICLHAVVACTGSEIVTFSMRHRSEHAEALARSCWAQGGFDSSKGVVLKNDRLPSCNDNFPCHLFLISRFCRGRCLLRKRR